MNFGIVINVISLCVIIFSGFMLLPLGVAFIYNTSEVFSFLISFFITFITGYFIYFLTRKYKHEEIKYREAFAIVTFTWIFVAFFGSLPYLLTGTLNSFTDAYFESMSGFTATGASVIADVESLPRGILFWRCMTQWIGGMGIVLFVLAVLPILGTGGMQLFKAEVPGVTVDKIRPRIVDTAKILWIIYASLTLIIAGAYVLCGMTLYEGMCHAFTTISTGGFSTKNASLAGFNNPLIEYVGVIGMICGSINFTIFFYLAKRDFLRVFKNEELRFYLLGILIISALIIIDLNITNIYSSWEESIRYGLFQVTTFITTTGYATSDYTKWTPFSQVILLFLMYIGGMIGSTAGGIKQFRFCVILKQIYSQFFHLIHPKAITTIRINERSIDFEIIGSIISFALLSLFVWFTATIILTFLGIDIITAISTTISALSSTGPALGQAGPASTYAPFPVPAKWVLVLCMLIGRLEYYTVLILFVPAFWKK